ncbi:MAG: M6 family metalloprotease domain-containing protein [Prevotella sp.]|nr:M6 family metalloprotease domain-containing protein [Prevotella sp.]
MMIPRAKVVYTFLATLCCATMLAIPAKRGQWKTITLSDGRQVKVELRGDERAHWWEDSIGNRYLSRGRTKEEGGRRYDTETRGVWSKECGVRNDDETRGVRNDDEIWEKIEEKDWSKRHNTRRYSPSSLLHPPSSKYSSTVPLPMEGPEAPSPRRGLIILVEFQNKQFREENDRVMFDRIANEKGFSERGFKGCVSDYFRDQSNGMLDLTFDVIGPVTINNDFEYYGKNVGPDNYDAHPDEMIMEACLLVDDEVNFAEYDWNGDGYVEQVVVIYAGQGEANGGGNNTIWPHEWSLTEADYGKPLSLDKVRIDTYACSPELSTRTRIDGIGTLCHEFSHCLGLPDMYDEDRKNYGMGNWDLMDQGSYNGNGFCPAGYTAYEKMYCGWQQPIVLTTDTVVNDMKPISDGGDTYIIYNDAHPNEFYMLENRQRIGWDKNLTGTGLLITHIDYDPDVWYWNMVNSFSTYYDKYYNEFVNDHERCTIFHADEDQSSTISGIIGDAYPFLFNDSLTVNSRPATTLHNKNSAGEKYMQVAIKNIKKNEDKTISFQFFQRGVASGIKHVKEQDRLDGAIYSMEGIYLGTDRKRLPKGIYIIGGKKTIIP